MFGGNQRNVFGESTFGKTKVQPTKLFSSSLKSDANKKPASGLFGMPPIPDISQSSDSSQSVPSKPSVESLFGKPVTTSGLFSNKSRSQDSFSNPFSSGGSVKSQQNVFRMATSQTSSSASAPAKPSGIFSKPEKVFGSNVNQKDETPDLFKSVVSGNAGLKPTFGTGSVFSSALEGPKKLFGGPSKKEDESKNVLVFGEPVSKKISREPIHEQMSSQKPKGGIFGEAFRHQSTPFFGKMSKGNITSAGDIESKSTNQPVSVFGSVKSRLGKRPLGHEAEQNEDEDKEVKKKIPAEEEQISLEAPPDVASKKLFSEKEIQQSHSIICKQVPTQALMNKKIIEQHFSKFGKVTRVVLNQSKESAIVHFENHDSARAAKLSGLSISPKIPNIGAIFFWKGRKRSGEFGAVKVKTGNSSNALASEESGVEKQPHSQTLKPKSDVTELMKVIKSQAHNDGDRFMILDARDKLVRLQTSGHHEGALRGTCPDMCPEKERYSRSDKNQLRWYEKIDGRVHHKAVIKEYSRSSADQDVPLSHELRPPSVLKLSMNHILCNVIDRIESMQGTMAEWYSQVQGRLHSFTGSGSNVDNVGDWFEYVWSATRAIRKDITQQDLKDPITVDLVEKCARFHIFCAERLIEEDPSRFDKKLNDENLTKCIQTLKHMYEDLRHQDIRCPNEPEFRAYDVILKLNDGDTLQSIETLDGWVRNSSEMRFALAVYSSLNTNNYVRFFKLVRQSTLLQGCLLLRYFNQARTTALATIVKAYVPSKSTVGFSLSKLTHLLAFEDNSQSALFCQMHGLLAYPEADIVVMDKNSFQFMESVPDAKRPINLVENKRNGTPWSVVINGGQALPPNPYLTYVPHDSFDSNGFLKLESMSAADQLSVSKEDSESILILPQPEAIPRSIPQQNLYMQECRELTDEIVGSVVDSECSSIANELIKEELRAETAFQVMEEIFSDGLNSVVQDVASETIRDCKNEELQRRLEVEAQLSAVEELSQDLVESVVSELVRETAVAEMKNVSRLLRLESLFALANQIVADICVDVVESELKIIGRTAVEELLLEREKKIETLRKKQKLHQLSKCFKSWRKFSSQRKRQKKILDNFPSMPSTHSVTAQLQRLGSSTSSLGTSSVLRLQKEVGLLLDAINVEDTFMSRAILERIDLPGILSKADRDSASVVFKLVICLPSLDEDSFSRPLCEMIKKKFSSEVFPLNDDTNVLNCVVSTIDDQHFEICVRVVTSQVLCDEVTTSEKKRRNILFGTSAILFLNIDSEQQDDETMNSYERLQSLIDHLPTTPAVPLCVLSNSFDDSSLVETALDLPNLKKARKISDYEIINCSKNIFDLNSITAVHEAATWLTLNCPTSTKPEGLCSKLITEFVEQFVSKVFIETVRSNLERRLEYRLPHQDPNVLIQFFNAVVDHLENVCAQVETLDVSWPVPELHGVVLKRMTNVPSYWNDPAYLEILRSSIRSLRLPEFSFSKFGKGPEDVVVSYFQSIQKSFVDATFCIDKLRHCLKKDNKLAAGNGSSFDDIPWTNLIEICIEYKIKSLDTQDQFSKDPCPMQVVYFDDHLKEFVPPKIWTTALSLRLATSSASKVHLSNETQGRASPRERLGDISVLVEEERARSEALEETLKQALNGSGQVLNSSPVQPSRVDPAPPSSFYVPVVAWFSPALSRVATSRSVKHRITTVTREESSQERHKRRRSLPSHLAEDRHVSRVDEVKAKLQNDLDQSFLLENRLKAALMQ